MKNLLFLVVGLFSLTIFGQSSDSTAVSKTKEPLDLFVSVGLSVSQGDFQVNSYPSVELGFNHENIAYSGVFGRGNFVDTFKSTDTLSNYWFEFKLSPYYSLGPLNGFLVAGGGMYFNSDHYFAELGFGLSYTQNKLTYGASFTNWDTRNYVTTFISFNP